MLTLFRYIPHMLCIFNRILVSIKWDLIKTWLYQINCIYDKGTVLNGEKKWFSLIVHLKLLFSTSNLISKYRAVWLILQGIPMEVLLRIPRGCLEDGSLDSLHGFKCYLFYNFGPQVCLKKKYIYLKINKNAFKPYIYWYYLS